MTKSHSLSLAAAMILTVAVLSTVGTGQPPVAATPFWQMQGASPAATDTDALTALRHASREGASETIVVAHR
jgi:hypothetical protein